MTLLREEISAIRRELSAKRTKLNELDRYKWDQSETVALRHIETLKKEVRQLEKQLEENRRKK